MAAAKKKRKRLVKRKGLTTQGAIDNLAKRIEKKTATIAKHEAAIRRLRKDIAGLQAGIRAREIILKRAKRDSRTLKSNDDFAALMRAKREGTAS